MWVRERIYNREEDKGQCRAHKRWEQVTHSFPAHNELNDDDDNDEWRERKSRQEQDEKMSESNNNVLAKITK